MHPRDLLKSRKVVVGAAVAAVAVVSAVAPVVAFVVALVAALVVALVVPRDVAILVVAVVGFACVRSSLAPKAAPCGGRPSVANSLLSCN